MANSQNLKPSEYKFTQEEAKKGGIASGEARRKRKLMRELLEDALFKNKNTKNKAIEITKALIDKACDGDVKAYEVIRDTLGEKPIEQIQNVSPPTIEDDV